MTRCNREKYLIRRDDIKEEMVLIEGSNTDYITKSGKVYKWYHDDMYYPKKTFVNNRNGYVYVGITYPDGQKSRRYHILLAKAFIENPNPQIYKVVGHRDNNKQNNSLNNLYWTTTQENTQKAVDDGLFKLKSGIENEKSNCVAVYDKQEKLVAVYNSICECARKIKNVSKGAIARCIKTDYKSRTRKYVYKKCDKEFYMSHKDLQNIELIEDKNEKKIRQFIMKNESLNIYILMDNQKQASKICGIAQAIISKILRNRIKNYQGWEFEVIKETSYKDSSAYQNMLNLHDNYLLQNIYTNEIKEFNSCQEIKDTFGLNSHDINQYCKTGHTLLNEWKVYRVSSITSEIGKAS